LNLNDKRQLSIAGILKNSDSVKQFHN